MKPTLIYQLEYCKHKRLFYFDISHRLLYLMVTSSILDIPDLNSVTRSDYVSKSWDLKKKVKGQPLKSWEEVKKTA